MLIVLMVPLTDLSAAIVIVPVAHADVVTGGVSSAPVNFTFTSRAEAVPMLTASAVAATSARTRRASKNIFMIHSWIRSRRERIRLFSPISTMLYAKKTRESDVQMPCARRTKCPRRTIIGQTCLEREPDINPAVLRAGAIAIPRCREKAVMAAGRGARVIVAILDGRVGPRVVVTFLRARCGVIVAMLGRHLVVVIVRSVLRA
jgi:hypothetical protein